MDYRQNQLQNEKVKALQPSGEGTGKETGSRRVFLGRTFLVHNSHVQSGRRYSSSCAFCANGLDGISKILEEAPPKTDLDTSGGDDEDGSTPSAYDSWRAGRE